MNTAADNHNLETNTADTNTAITGSFLNNPDQRVFRLEEGEMTYCCGSYERTETSNWCGHTPNEFQTNKLVPCGKLVEVKYLCDDYSNGGEWREYFRVTFPGQGKPLFVVVHHQERFSTWPDRCWLTNNVPSWVRR